MKILFFTKLFYPHIGGIEKHIVNLSKILIKKGHKIQVITTKFNEGLKDHESYDGIQIYRFKQPNIKFVGLFLTWYWLLKNISLIKESDVLHVHDVFIWYWPIRLLLPKKKVYLTFHGHGGIYPIPLKDILQKRIGRKLSSGVISIGEFVNKIYGIKSDIISYGAVKLPKPIGKKNKKLILYVGRLDKSIPLSIYFKVFKSLKNYKLSFCGDGELAQEARKYGKVKGFVDPTPYYSDTKYVFASGYLTILEAFANRCLVFTAYNNPLLEDYYLMTPFSKFIVCSDKPSKLINKFKYLNKHPAELRVIIEKSYEWVRTQTWNKLADDYVKLWGIV